MKILERQIWITNVNDISVSIFAFDIIRIFCRLKSEKHWSEWKKKIKMKKKLCPG